MTTNREYTYRWSYRRRVRMGMDRYRVKHHDVMAHDEDDAVVQAPVSLPGGWKRFEFLGRVD